MTHGDIREAVALEVERRRIARRLFGHSGKIDVSVQASEHQPGTTDVIATLTHKRGELLCSVIVCHPDDMPATEGKDEYVKFVCDFIEARLSEVAQNIKEGLEHSERLRADYEARKI